MVDKILPPFNSVKTCPGCGRCVDLNSVHGYSSIEVNQILYTGEDSKIIHMRRSCSRCGYRWYERPYMDSKTNE